MESRMWPSGMMSNMKAPRNSAEMRMLEFILANQEHQRQKALQMQAERQKVQRGILGDIAKEISVEAKEIGSSLNELSQPELMQELQRRYQDRVNMYAQQGLLPAVMQEPEPIEAEPERPGRGYITVMESKEDVQRRLGYTPKYDKGTRLIQAPNGSQIVAEPQKDGTFKLKGRDIDAEGNHVWKPIKNTISAEELDNITSGQWTYAGEDEKLQKPKPNTVAKPVVRAPISEKPEMPPSERKIIQSNMLPAGNTVGSAMAETAKDMLYRAPLKAIGEENVSAAGNTLADMFYRAPKAALTPSDEQREFRMQQVREADPWGRIKKGSEWLSEKVLGGLRPY